MTSDHITAYAGNVFWFKVHDILPAPHKIVLVSGGIAKCNEDGEWYTDSGIEIDWFVEYWAELPNPPKST